MRLLSITIIASVGAALAARHLLGFDAVGVVTSYALSGQIVLGAALVAAIVLDTKT